MNGSPMPGADLGGYKKSARPRDKKIANPAAKSKRLAKKSARKATRKAK